MTANGTPDLLGRIRDEIRAEAERARSAEQSARRRAAEAEKQAAAARAEAAEHRAEFERLMGARKGVPYRRGRRARA